ncbi:MAG: hypothetical protein F4Z53_12205 [Acidimicrobiales bacterium]|nr:hypothetical protein [Acidimicrobiales bacterium]MXY02282.1 hypothetical protein [Acidimicrobiales bacterium]MYD34459.1 hypothetical protein [Acidimicrobiales bacterium]MYI09367.1 hypothetical protein [Acidimicrobiales bacterium]MYI27895.1 hypothetical protein [Acidimicrobiales bacterium]
MSFADRIRRVHASLAEADIPHAFGGAIAVNWCTPQARVTNDIDINIFISPEHAESALVGLPAGTEITEEARQRLLRDGQARFWWETVPIDVFLNTTEFHVAAASRVETREFEGAMLPCLACGDIAVFKAFFDRGKDWMDIEAMTSIGSFDIDAAMAEIEHLLGPDDPRIAKLAALRNPDDG